MDALDDDVDVNPSLELPFGVHIIDDDAECDVRLSACCGVLYVGVLDDDVHVVLQHFVDLAFNVGEHCN